MKLTVKDVVVFGMTGALMIVLDMLMDVLPNIHLLGVLIVATTVVFRAKALFPIYVYVFLTGLLNGFSTWWIPYMYVWTALWGVTMLLPKRMPKAIRPIVYCAVCAAHGFAFGTLYAPAQALLFGLNAEATVAWIIGGLPFDIIHGISNAVCGLLICPLIAVFERVDRLTRG